MATLTQALHTKTSSPAIIIPSGGPTLSYPEVVEAVRSFQEQLSGAGLQPGDTVSMALINSLEFVVAFFGITGAKLVSAPLNPSYSEAEFSFYLEDSKSKVLLVHEGWTKEQKPAVLAAAKFNVAVYEIGWSSAQNRIVLRQTAGSQVKGINLAGLKAAPEDVALLLHTSGTTGRPKGVPLSHQNITRTMGNIINTYDLRNTDTTYLVMPLFHVHGLVCGLLASLKSGGTVVIPPKFSATVFWKEFIETGCTWYTAVPTIHQILLRHPSPSQKTKIRFIRSCSSSLAPATFEQLEKVYGVPVLEAYAMTEAAHQMTSNPLPPASRKPGSVGIGQGVQIAILDDQGNPAELGEVCIKGENVTKGYLNNPSANESSFTKDGWFRTGDQGKIDKEGYLFLTGRIKELINRGGEKISPLEVDGTLLHHPKVSEVVCFAVPDTMYGQEVHAAVIPKNGETVTEKELQDFCRKSLASFKIPKKIYITDFFPKTATGKIQRRVVSDYFFKKAKL
ncbi:putative peroxisomal-coenzyme A synthetase [Basidiobolus meristosporus CBS 931.73]|uniref:Putative peroxisomal-coenzyme A synthetase n=1 Tax=Basidiobolus meristosporus CBS 931.73 TaxID=1314790 RepID=A0A1Y1XUF7_9FUNG|nr:putative peroxisomal-coenzyme A synthetase [Basidiobolus meristosporus CBS 931.73]|eukprot:ORX89315.1 putative peroxisomal-coenzyme A synthetase [Basidiobolus meristosporus CBS 931.73]